MKSRELIVPVGKIANAGETIPLTLRASDLETLPLFHAQHLRPMPDHWDMPVGFDERDFFMVGGGGWIEATLPFMKTSPTVSGTPPMSRTRTVLKILKNPISPPGCRYTTAWASESAMWNQSALMG